jgi:hypothetical protein
MLEGGLLEGTDISLEGSISMMKSFILPVPQQVLDSLSYQE